MTSSVASDDGLPVLETERLILRGPRADDFPAFLAYSTSDRSVHVGGPVTTENARGKFEDLSAQWKALGYGRFVIVSRASGISIGHTGPLKVSDGTPVEMTWTLWDGRHEGKGYAREAAEAALAWSFQQLAIDHMNALIHPDNKSSRRLAEALGARFLGEAEKPHNWLAAVYRFARPAPT